MEDAGILAMEEGNANAEPPSEKPRDATAAPVAEGSVNTYEGSWTLKCLCKQQVPLRSNQGIV
jgi:hypothetical protein